jgi:hypothetical protein
MAPNTRYFRMMTTFSGLAVAAAGGLGLGAATAQADPVQIKPGLSCDDVVGFINCTNDTDTDVTVVQKRDCPGGTKVITEYGYGYNAVSGGFSSGTPMTRYVDVDPSVEFTSIFVAAHNTGFGQKSCEGDSATSITYTTEAPGADQGPPPPPA